MNKIDWSELKYRIWKKYDSIVYPFVFTYEWIVKSFQYSLFLKNDKDWDFNYILKLLKYKLERTRKCINKNNIIADTDKVCKQIRIAEILLDRIIRDEYCKYEYDLHEEKWGELDFIKNGLQRRFVISDKDKESERLEFRRIMNKEEYLRKYDYSYLFNHLRKYIQMWWD